MQLDLAGRVAVVTGAGRGLGRAVALGLASFGAKVAVVARTAAQVAESAASIRAADGHAIGIAADIADPANVEALRDQVHRELGPATILINAAGVFGPIQVVADSDAERWIDTIRINTIGPYLTCRAFAPDMIAARWGRIINCHPSRRSEDRHVGRHPRRVRGLGTRR
jgi:NAD(P)-dependent dehydrogenase (short-subunit alcohol dehydrogenase family)